MKLNALTRLCITLYVLGVTLTPPIGWIIIATDSNNRAFEWHRLCLGMTNGNKGALDKCTAELMAHRGPEALPLMWELFVGALQAGAILWLICFAATRTIRWILAGRQN